MMVVNEKRLQGIFETEWLSDERVRDLETLPWIKHFQADENDEDMLVKFVFLKRGAQVNVAMLHFSSNDYQSPDTMVIRRARQQIEQIVNMRKDFEDGVNGRG